MTFEEMEKPLHSLERVELIEKFVGLVLRATASDLPNILRSVLLGMSDVKLRSLMADEGAAIAERLAKGK